MSVWRVLLLLPVWFCTTSVECAKEDQWAVGTNDEENDSGEHGDLDKQEVMCARRIRDDVHNIQ